MARPDAEPDVTTAGADETPRPPTAAEAGRRDRRGRRRSRTACAGRSPTRTTRASAAQRQVADARADERARVAAAWLPVVDNLERALEHADADADAVIEGVRAVRDQAVGLLARARLPTTRRDRSAVRPATARGGQRGAATATRRRAPCCRCVRPGYGDGTAQLRPAAVVVAGGPE